MLHDATEGKGEETMPRTLLFQVFCRVVIMLPVLSGVVAAAPPSPGSYPARATVADTYGTGVQSDGLGPYVHGVDGVLCLVYDQTSDSNGGLSLNLVQKNSRNILRTLRFQFGSEVSVTCGPNAGPLPSEAQAPFLAIQQIHQIPVRGAEPRAATFYTVGTGRLHYGLYQHCNPVPVLVERLNPTTWRITAAPTAVAVLYQEANKQVTTRYMNMPFQVTVELLSGN
jgi:hypothetical protein